MICLYFGGCANSPNATSTLTSEQKSQPPITQAEAKFLACPKALLEAGASAADCQCVENKLYELGQSPEALEVYGRSPKALFGDETGIRDIAIGLLRHDAIEHCGLFHPDHIVAKNL